MGDFDKKPGSEDPDISGEDTPVTDVGGSGAADNPSEPTVDFEIIGGADDPGRDRPFMISIPGRGLILPAICQKSIIMNVNDATRSCVADVVSGRSVIDAMNWSQLKARFPATERLRARIVVTDKTGRWSAADSINFGHEDSPDDILKRVVVKVNDLVGSKDPRSVFGIKVEIKI